jgi:transcriptional regulator GlxA family with amidase domain
MAPPIRVALVAIPEASISTLHGPHDVLNSLGLARRVMDALPEQAPFHVEIVGVDDQPLQLASGLTTVVHRSVADIAEPPNVIIVPSIVLGDSGWITGRFPQLIEWMRVAHERGTLLCSACSGVFLLAETGLLNHHDVTLQLLRVEEAKRRLESTNIPIETIAWQVGYEDAAFFRRLFKRLTGVTPGHYRRRFGLPAIAESV